jgi:hypothetical protein
MTELPVPPESPVDLGVLYADDLLLNALGRGEPAPADDHLATVLAAWRAELAADEPAAAPVEAPVEAPVAAADATPAEVVPIRRARSRRGARLAVAAAVFAAVAGGTGVAAALAPPGSPLWPLTHLVNPDRADVLDAEAAVGDARRAATDGRTADAQRLVAQADKLISRVRDPGAAARLRAELDEVRRLLTTAGAPTTAPGTGPARPTPSPTPPGTGAGAGPGTGSGGNGQPAQTPAPGGTTQAPGPVVPTLPVPTSIPPILPSLPIVGGL